MVDTHNLNLTFILVEFVKGPIGAASSRPDPLQLPLQLMADPARVPEERTQHELDHRRCGLFRQTTEGPLGRRRN